MSTVWFEHHRGKVYAAIHSSIWRTVNPKSKITHHPYDEKSYLFFVWWICWTLTQLNKRTKLKKLRSLPIRLETFIGNTISRFATHPPQNTNYCSNKTPTAPEAIPWDALATESSIERNCAVTVKLPWLTATPPTDLLVFLIACFIPPESN